MNQTSLYNEITKDFSQYSGAVLQSRALVDVRDCIKPSARQIFYSMLERKLIYNKSFKKTTNAVGMAMADYYIHGDSSCTGIIMRSGQNFAMRYPLVDVKGNAGSLIESGNYAAPRYTESRLGKLGCLLFKDIDKKTIEEWRDNYDNTKQYPAVLPSKGFYNICNGTQGIGVGLASSIPQFNLKEMNKALTYLIDNPDCSFDDIYCAPDFATGAILYNESEVKESMKNGQGLSCKLRSVIEFDKKERCFVVTEIPYSVYTNTICGQLEDIINSDNNPGIDRFNDLTGKTPLLKIYLNKKANPDNILKFLYKNTSLQYYYGINFTMLDKGRFPKVFTWKEMLQAHIDHEREVYRRGFEFDLRKIDNRIHIIDGLLTCLANIDEVVKMIKSSVSTAAASKALQASFMLDEAQAKAVLDMKLSRLAHLEVEKLQNEKVDLEKESQRIHAILDDDELFKNEIKNGWREVSTKFGDDRRTRIMDLTGKEEEVIEKKQISLSFTNEGGMYATETSTLYAQRRGGVGNKFKLDRDEFIIDNLVGQNTDTALFFTDQGNFYPFKLGTVQIETKEYLNSFVNILPTEKIVAAEVLEKGKEFIIFITKNGIIKKSKLSEYNLKRKAGALAIKLDAGDTIVSVIFTNEDKIGMLSKDGNFIMIGTKEINPIGRVTRGVVGMKLNADDCVVSAKVVPSNTSELLSITTDGYSKRSNINEFKVTGRGTKGSKIQKSSSVCDFLPLAGAQDILVISNLTQLRVHSNEISLLSRGAQGTKTIKLSDTSKVIKISLI